MAEEGPFAGMTPDQATAFYLENELGRKNKFITRTFLDNFSYDPVGKTHWITEEDARKLRLQIPAS